MVADSDGIVGVTFDVPNLRPDGANDPDTPLSVVVDHVEYVADRIGVEHVALGSDFDGCTIPAAVGDAAGLPHVLDSLRTRRFSREAVREITRENWLRVLHATWA